MIKNFFKAFCVLAAVLIAVPAMAATYTVATVGTAQTDPGEEAKGVYVQSGYVDCNDTSSFPSGVTCNDVVQLATIPADTWVRSITVQVIRASSYSGVSGTLGTGFTTNGFALSTGSQPFRLDTVNLVRQYDASLGTSGVSTDFSLGGSIASGASLFKDQGDTIDWVVLTNKATTGTTPAFTFFIECVPADVD